MSKFTFHITKRAIMNSTVRIEAKSEEEAREKLENLEMGIAENCVNPADGSLVESVNDLRWDFQELDDSDNVEVFRINKH